MLLYLSNAEKRGRQIFDFFAKFILVLCAISVFLSLAKMYLLYVGLDLAMVYGTSVGSVPWGSSLVRDYNMFSLTLLSGLVLSIHFFFSKQHRSWRPFLIGLYVMLMVVGLHSGSRRFMVATVVVHLIYISGYIFSVSRERWWADKDPATAGSMMENQHINLRNVSLFFLFFTFVWLCFSSLQLEFFGEEKRSLTQTRFESLFNSQRFFGLDSRIDKWIYAFDLFSDRNITSFYGFDYRQRFGCQFFNCAYEDYPHNPILSAALYGGILGGLITLLVFVYPLLILIKNINFTVLFFTQFSLLIIFMSFSFISGDSIYSIPSLILYQVILLANFYKP